MITRALIVFATAALTGCGLADAKGPEHLPVSQGCFVAASGQHPVVLEVASQSSDRQKGLMGREALAENAGMLFTYGYERTSEQGFWMYKTLLPLDIAFLDQQGVIVNIREMHPCASSRSGDCPSYPAGASYWSAVEMNAGYFADHGIITGDRLILNQATACTD
ncbi:DUF192 domain-containing protein [Marinobacter daepoensis]|uniref:DUF192 domain-containing protein n=1 Tax=Marinobacter daepoensis TaxID=262077 RepID=UPI000427399A|nr:DUF192 domain-containing protein [Marinobacter daepoensis]